MFVDISSRKPGQQLEYLPSPDRKRLAETLVAFANSDGGFVVLGLAPSGEVTDEFSEEDIEGLLQQAVLDSIPPVEIRNLHKEELPNGGQVFVMEVPRSPEMHTLSDGRVVVRAGAENRTLKGHEIRHLASTRSTGDFESEPIAGAGLDDLSPEVIEEYMQKRSDRTGREWDGTVEELLQAIGAVDQQMRPTVAGMLLFGKNPEYFLPQSGLVFVHFRGTEPKGEGYGRREEIYGHLAKVIERAWQVIWEEMDKEAIVKGLVREEHTEYPKVAVREALVNAVCHRDYRISGRKIEVKMFADRLEIVSPGGLPGYITLDNILDEHYSRNPRIVNGLMQWGYIEELGLGMDRIFESMTREGHPPPDLDSTPYRFMITLRNVKRPSIAPEWESSMNERQLKALQYIQEHGRITNREYRKLCPHVSAETLRLDLVDLVNRGVLLKIGEKKGTYYILK